MQYLPSLAQTATLIYLLSFVICLYMFVRAARAEFSRQLYSTHGKVMMILVILLFAMIPLVNTWIVIVQFQEE